MGSTNLDAARPRRAAALAAVLIALWPAAVSLAAGSQLDASGTYAIRWWTVEDGVASMPLVGLAVADDDAVWCASRSHIMRFDGRRFAALPEPVTASLRDKLGDFRGLGFAPDGRLWLVGTTGAAVARPLAAIDRATPADWATHAHAGGEFWGLTFGPDGLPLFFGKNRIVSFDNGRFANHPLSGPAPGFVYYAAAFDRRTADLWLWGNGRARRIRNGAAQAADGPVAKRITNMAAGDSGVWAGLVDIHTQTVDGAAVFRDDAWHEYPMITKPATAAREGHICEGPGGTVWLATHAALYALRDGTWQTILEGLPGFSLTTQRLEADREGALWAACTGGLLSISRTSVKRAPMPASGVVTTLRDGSLASGVTGAVIRLQPPAEDQAGDAWHHDTIHPLPPGVTPTAITEAADGTLFVGTRDSFLYVVGSGPPRMVTQPRTLSLEVRNVNALARDTAGSVWAGTTNGLARYSPERDVFEFIDAFIKPSPASVLGLHAEDDGSLLVAVQGRGIERIKPDGRITPEVPAALMPGKRSVQFLRTADDTLWAAGDLGLVRRDSSGPATLFDTRNGLADRAIVQLAADDAGRLWLAFREGRLQGIRIADLADLAAGRRNFVRGVMLGPLDGLGDAELLGGLVHVPGHGLLATTSAGLVTVDTARYAAPEEEDSAATIAVEHDFVAGQSRFRWGDVTTNEFDPPLYQTRLGGVDADWSVPATDTDRTFASIPPGRHRFEVRHLRGDAVKASPTGAVEITIPTPFWKTTWFLTTVAFGLTALAAAGGTAVSRAVARRRIAQLEREQERHRDRARIARDLHDSLGAGLAQMAMLSDVMRRGAGGQEAAGGGSQQKFDEALDEMFRSAQRLTRAVDEIVWAVDPANDTVPRLFTFLAHEVERLARSGGLELSIHVDDDVPDVVLPSMVQHHLLMILREAVANVFKHARATTLDVSLRHRSEAIDVTIADDGVGFTPAAAAPKGHDGLANMRARVDELGGTVVIDSGPGRGTRIDVHVPLTAQAVLPGGGRRL